MAKAPKINVTKDYTQFHRSADNRETDVAKHKRLRESMEQYGYIAAFPVVCTRDRWNRLVVKDGQHRLMLAEQLGLPVFWVEVAENFDVATINCAQKRWKLRDYAQRFAESGNKNYKDAMEFAAAHGLPLGLSFALLAGTVALGAVLGSIQRGDYKVKDREWADAVVAVYCPIVEHFPALKHDVFLQACMSVCRVPDFDGPRLVRGFQSIGGQRGRKTRTDYLTDMEAAYNHNRTQKNRVPLKFQAEQVMRERFGGPGATAEAA